MLVMGLKDINFGKIELKSEKGEIYGEGFVSTTDPDLFDDIVSNQAQSSMLKQFKDRVVKCDLDHDKFRDPVTGEVYNEPKNLNPPAKIIHAELKETDDGSLGTFVKVHFNKNHSRFNEIINSIKDGFIDAFSIGYSVTKSNPITRFGKTFREIKDLIVHNVAFTGDAVNPKAKMRLALKSFPIKKMDKTIEDYKTEIAELKSLHTEELEKVQAELKAKGKEYKDSTSAKDKEIADLKDADKKKSDANKTEMKSINDKKDKEILELKSKFEKSELSVTELKSKVDEYEAQPMLKDIKLLQKEYKSQMFDKNDEPKLMRFNC